MITGKAVGILVGATKGFMTWMFDNPVWPRFSMRRFHRLGCSRNGGIGCGNEIAPNWSTVKMEMITTAATAHV